MNFLRRIKFNQINSASRGFSTLSLPQATTTSSVFSQKAKFIAAATLTASAAYSLSTPAFAEGSFGVNDTAVKEQEEEKGLYPEISPYEEGYLKVSDVHTLYYACYGNPNGKPVLFIHGGPGGGTVPDMARFFDPKVYRIVLVDQRGCGKSTPFANLVDNTTWHSIEDFEKIRKKLNINQWQLFGGSWGSTLALAYAIKHPEVVLELVLRGIFLLRKKELDWLYEGKGANFVFPKEWEEYHDFIPENERDNFILAYHKRLSYEGTDPEKLKIRAQAARIWSTWEGRTSKLVQAKEEAINDSFGADDFSLAFARIENHYFINKGFFDEGYLLKKENLDKIRHIPMSIVQGRYDMVCPAISAHELHKALPNSNIVYTITGHSGFEQDIIKQLVKFTDSYKYRWN